jgi:hypothetical protein
MRETPRESTVPNDYQLEQKAARYAELHPRRMPGEASSPDPFAPTCATPTPSRKQPLIDPVSIAVAACSMVARHSSG